MGVEQAASRAATGCGEARPIVSVARASLQHLVLAIASSRVYWANEERCDLDCPRACCPDGPSVEGTGARGTGSTRRSTRIRAGSGAMAPSDRPQRRARAVAVRRFVHRDLRRARERATMVRNSVAVMDGVDLATAPMTFAWRDGRGRSSPRTPIAGSGRPTARHRQRPAGRVPRRAARTPSEGLSRARRRRISRGARGVDPSGPRRAGRLSSRSRPRPRRTAHATASIACSTVETATSSRAGQRHRRASSAAGAVVARCGRRRRFCRSRGGGSAINGRRRPRSLTHRRS